MIQKDVVLECGLEEYLKIPQAENSSTSNTKARNTMRHGEFAE